MGRRRLDEKIDEKIMAEVMKQTVKMGTGLVSTKEIAKRLGISEPVIFTHFKTKADLMNATFVFAWKPFLRDPILEVVKEHGRDTRFEYYKAAMEETLTWKKETVYIHHYLASSYFNAAVVNKTTASYLKSLTGILQDFNGTIPENDFTLIARSYVEERIDLAKIFVTGDFSINDDNLRIAFNLLTGGLQSAIQEDATHYQK